MDFHLLAVAEDAAYIEYALCPAGLEMVHLRSTLAPARNKRHDVASMEGAKLPKTRYRLIVAAGGI